MSGIYIPGMEMPKRCLACQLNYDSCACILTGSRYYKHGVEFDPGEERLPDCPLIPVPNHGRLVDADALIEKIIEQENNDYNINHTPRNWARAFCAFEEVALDAPTIIPGEEVDNG